MHVPSKKKGAGPLFQIRREKKWGYMDRNGGIIVQPRFDDEHDFFHGLAGVQIGGKWGFVDEKGRMVIPPKFDTVGDFLGDLAPVRVGRRWGYIDTTGRMIVEPHFQEAMEFHEGVARVYVWDKVVCSSGEYTKEDAPEEAFLMPDWNRVELPGCFPKGGRFGFIDKTGAFTIKPRFFAAQDFSDGLSAVRVEESPDSKYGYIDQTGALPIAPRFNQAKAFSEGLALVEISARQVGNLMVDIAWGFVDKTGRLAIPAKYHFAGSFSEGLARVQVTDSMGNYRMGYIDKDGKAVFPPRFDSADDFSDGLAAVSENGCAYIDHSGAPVIKGVCSAWPFRDGLAVVGQWGRQVYIDKTGRVVAAYESGEE